MGCQLSPLPVVQVTYCLMLDLEQGDLVQCLRHSGSIKGEASATPYNQIHTSRLSLHEGPVRHGEQWYAHVKPRLYDFSEAVHRMRASSNLRFQYLLGNHEQRRHILAEQLPHLSHVLLRR
jgi:hypothetical protein